MTKGPFARNPFSRTLRCRHSWIVKSRWTLPEQILWTPVHLNTYQNKIFDVFYWKLMNCQWGTRRFLSQKLINYTLTINPWEQMNTKGAILASLNGGFYFLGFLSLSLCCLIVGQLYFLGFYFSKKMYTKRPENSVYKIDGWWNALDHFTIGKSWVSRMAEISAPTSDYDVFLLIWTPAWSLCVSCKVKNSQELACELKEKSF